MDRHRPGYRHAYRSICRSIELKLVRRHREEYIERLAVHRAQTTPRPRRASPDYQAWYDHCRMLSVRDLVAAHADEVDDLWGQRAHLLP